MALTVQNIQFLTKSHIQMVLSISAAPLSKRSMMSGNTFAVHAQIKPMIKGFSQPVLRRLRLKKDAGSKP